MIGSTRGVRVVARAHPTDLRLGFDGHYGLVCGELAADPRSDDLFLLVNLGGLGLARTTVEVGCPG